MHRHSNTTRAFSVLAILTGSLGITCSADKATPAADGPAVQVAMAALTLPGVNDAVWDVEVTEADGDPVFRVRITSGTFGDGRGSATYIGPCVAGEDNVVNVWLRGIYTAAEPLVGDPGGFGADTPNHGSTLLGSADYVNPGLLTRSFPCVENEDTLVEFDVTVMRPARQGFFDIAIDFNDIFCSAKFDTGLEDEDEICRENLLLHNPDNDGQRDRTYVLALACTAGAGQDVATALYMDDIVITCPGGVEITINPNAGVGNRRIGDEWTGVTIEPPTADIADYLFQVAMYRGAELLAGLNKRYWNLAIGAAAPGRLDDCSLTTKASADDLEEPVAIGKTIPHTIDSGMIYPYIRYSIPDLGVCDTYPIGAVPGAPGTSPGYTYPDDDPLDFDRRYPGLGPTCDDGEKNGDETDVDCGGSCPPCGLDKICVVGSDCFTTVCKVFVCAEPSCEDGEHNGDETGVDCGGSCTGCPIGGVCNGPEDCASGFCPDHICRPGTCDDGEENGDETDVDCGGSCPPCDDGESCLVDGDCLSGSCPGGTCAGGSCTDSIKNGDELGVDCGGSCDPCAEVISISAGNNHSCAVLADGSAWCWGANGEGELGVGFFSQQSPSPSAVLNLTDVAAVVAGGNRSCARLDNGTAWCWGRALNGALGNGVVADLNFNTPQQVLGPGGSGFIQDVAWLSTSAGSNHACAARTDGSAWCWGYGVSGQLGNGNDSSTIANYRSAVPVQVLVAGGPLQNVEQVSAGSFHSCARLENGTVWCWGVPNGRGDGGSVNANRALQVKGPDGVGTLQDVTWISSGHYYSCATKNDGTVWCWGQSNNGQLGIGPSTGSRPYPVQVLGPGGTGLFSNAGTVHAGYVTTCSTRSDGSAWCWGNNTQRQLGIGGNSGSTVTWPIQVVGVGEVGALADVAEVAMGVAHACARSNAGVAWCWGNDSHGRLGDGPPTPLVMSSPSPVLW